MFSEKVAKFEKIFVILLTRASCSVRATAYLSKSRRRFLKTNVDKSYHTNFNTILFTNNREFSWPFCLNENDVGSCLARAEVAAAECSLLLFSHPVSWGYYKIPVCW